MGDVSEDSSEFEPIWGPSRRLELLLQFVEYLKGLLFRITHRPMANFLILSFIGVFFILATVIYTTDTDEFRDNSDNVSDIQRGGVAIVMEIVYFFGSWSWAAFLIPILFLGFVPDVGGRFTGLLTCTFFSITLAKIIIHEARPFWMNDDVRGYLCENDFGMPACHSAIAMVVYCYLARELWVSLPGLGAAGHVAQDFFAPKTERENIMMRREQRKDEAIRHKAVKDAKYDHIEETAIPVLAGYRKGRALFHNKRTQLLEDYSALVGYFKVFMTIAVRVGLIICVPLILASIGFAGWYLGSQSWMQAIFGFIMGCIIFTLWHICENLLQRYHHNLVNHSLFLQIVVWCLMAGVFLGLGVGTWYAAFYTVDIPDEWEDNFDDHCNDDVDINFEPEFEALVAVLCAAHAALIGYSITSRVCVREWWRVGYCRRAARAVLGCVGFAVLFVPLYYGIPSSTYFSIRIVFGTIFPVYVSFFWVFGVMPWVSCHCCCGRLGVRDFEWEETFSRANVLYQETSDLSDNVDGSSSTDESSIEEESSSDDESGTRDSTDDDVESSIRSMESLVPSSSSESGSGE